MALVLCKKLHISEQQTIELFLEKERKLPANAINAFYSSIGSLIGFINNEADLALVSEICAELAETLSKHNPESVKHLFSAGMPFLKQFMQTPDQIHTLAEKFIKFIELCEGTEDKVMKALSSMNHLVQGILMRNALIKDVGLFLFDEFLIPVAKSQTVATFMILESTVELSEISTNVGSIGRTSLYAIGGKMDLELIRDISRTYLTRANVILQDILYRGYLDSIIPTPISKDAEIIKAFLSSTPAYILALYPPFKEIYLGNDPSTRDEKIFLLFKDVRQMKEELFEGTLTKKYDEKMLLSVLYFVFACHDMTVPKENYELTWRERQDRSSDIPREFSRPINISLSRGSFILKDKNRDVDSEAWKLIIEAASKIKEKKAFDVAGFGFKMMDALTKNNLKQNRQFFIFGVYQHSLNNGEHLPEFRLEHQTLMKYKEFIGDRIANDLIRSILQKSMRKNPELLYEQQMLALGRKKIDFKGLAKQLFGVLNSGQPEEKTNEIVMRILAQNGFAIENTDALKGNAGMSPAQLNNWLASMKPNVIEKVLLARIFTELYGDEYAKMQEEMGKYEFKREARIGGGKKYILLISKKKAHSLAMYNMGVCVAPDDELWNDPNFWQLMIFDEDKNAHGGAILRFIEDEGKKYLVLSIQPTSSILSQTSPDQIFDKIVQAGKVIAGKTRCSGVLIPESAMIHSNRGSIQGVISSRYKEKDKITLSKEHTFSYSPDYTYKDFYKA